MNFLSSVLSRYFYCLRISKIYSEEPKYESVFRTAAETNFLM